MKKFIVCLITLMTVVSLAGCGKKDSAKDNRPELTGSMEEIIEQIYENYNPELSLATIPVDLTDEFSYQTYTGLSDVSMIKEAAASEPMIGSQAYSVTLVRVTDDTDTKKLAEDMMAGIDPRKWICVEADDIRAAGSGNLILYVMISSELSDVVTAEQIIDAFETVTGGLDFELTK